MEPVPEVLKELRDRLQASNPDEQAVPYNRSSYDKYFAADSDFAWLCRHHPNKILRGEVAKLAPSIGTNDNWESIKVTFLAAMLWGFGKVGYGAYRTAAMLGDDGAKKMLQRSYALISKGNLRAAYEGFYLPHCGPAFFSKYFYFLGRGTGAKPMPLILDSRVAASLECLLGQRATSQLVKAGARDANGRISSVLRYSDGYIRYVEMMNCWATKLGCRPDSIELLLFTGLCSSRSRSPCPTELGEDITKLASQLR